VLFFLIFCVYACVCFYVCACVIVLVLVLVPMLMLVLVLVLERARVCARVFVRVCLHVEQNEVGGNFPQQQVWLSVVERRRGSMCVYACVGGCGCLCVEDNEGGVRGYSYNRSLLVTLKTD
jgi:hypothetical protein